MDNKGEPYPMAKKRPHQPDAILIRNLEIFSHIGITREERTEAQRLTVSLEIEPLFDFWALNDRIENTIDYAEVCEIVKTLSLARPRRLIETLAEEIATDLLARYRIERIVVELHKFILPETEYVAVRIDRPAP